MAITLQNCLDKIGYSGTPSVNLVELNDLYGKFIRSIPVSSMHIDGVATYNETQSQDRCILTGEGAACLGLASTFKFMLDQIGFTTDYVGVNNDAETWDDQAGLMVTIGTDSFICLFGFYHQGINKPIKIEDGFNVGEIEVSFNGSEYEISTPHNSVVYFQTYARALSYWQTRTDNELSSGFLVNYKVIFIALNSGKWRMYNNGTIKDSDGNAYPYDDQAHDLLALFKFSGTV